MRRSNRLSRLFTIHSHARAITVHAAASSVEATRVRVRGDRLRQHVEDANRMNPCG
jgi:hypothetical protein